ncbi:MAG: HupE/UreJ family protein [Verrucomicrobiota bacterium]|nr:HupE/UreJ family protein [Verrucomicrobiota bacterium]
MSRAARFARGRLALIGLFALTLRALGHTPDTSYTKVKVAGEELEVTFAFDLLTLGRIAALDANRDAQITPEELRRAAPQIGEFLRRNVMFSIDGAPAGLGEALPMRCDDPRPAIPVSDFPSTLARFPFRQTLGRAPRELSMRYDIFRQLGERHTVLVTVAQDGREEQDVISELAPAWTYDVRAEPSWLAQSARFLKLGVKHIFLGYDHILFLLALIVVSSLRELVKIITSFTVAHTITLALAALEIVRLPSRLVETAIAVTIMFVALQNLWTPNPAHRWALTFVFGLIHGFGFANVLRDLELPVRGFTRALLAFNLGVEIGQLAIVAAILPVTLWLSRSSAGAKVKAAVSVAIYVFGTAWFVERAFGLRFMPI